ncbi:uncharacterized protein J4E84_007355 [Alternaria hordeiaustralica]|uniref:uncharacterized protein n=1 Tax=Alternaria hordeiaustralica TaxID=1187925 RepID=UPI0020C4A735|nr:uncharacterized protein J4E84_007355 [Alternaria hordeiaustralica]KAI4681760.1 hypothetical protein J4E84_007355 [Alternaria hordeiaustralica]
MANTPHEPQAAPVFSSATRGEIVTIFIGPEKKRYNIHKDIICHHSEYFRTSFNGRWKESDEGVTLEDVEVPVFNVFVHWLYAQEIPSDWESILRLAEASEFVSLQNSSSYGYACVLVLKCVIFGDRFLTPVFHRLAHNTFVNDHFIEKGMEICSSVTYTAVIWAFDNLPTDSPILVMMVDLQGTAWDEWHDNEAEKRRRSRLPHEFLVAVMLKQTKIRSEEEKMACAANGKYCHS